MILDGECEASCQGSQVRVGMDMIYKTEHLNRFGECCCHNCYEVDSNRADHYLHGAGDLATDTDHLSNSVSSTYDNLKRPIQVTEKRDRDTIHS